MKSGPSLRHVLCILPIEDATQFSLIQIQVQESQGGGRGDGVGECQEGWLGLLREAGEAHNLDVAEVEATRVVHLQS